MDGAGNTGARGRPVEVQRSSAEHLEGDRAELGDATIEAVIEVIAHDEEGALGNSCALKSGGRIARAHTHPDEMATGCGRVKRLAVDEDGASSAGLEEVAGEPDDALDEESVGGGVLQNDEVSALRRLRVICPRVCDDAIAGTNRGTHRCGGNFIHVETRLVQGVHGRRSESTEDNDDCEERISEPGERNRGFWLPGGGGSSSGFRSDENLPNNQNDYGCHHRPKMEEQTRVGEQCAEDVRDDGNDKRLARLAIEELAHAGKNQAEQACDSYSFPAGKEFWRRVGECSGGRRNGVVWEIGHRLGGVSSALFGGKEEVIGRIGHARFLADVARIAAGGRSLASLGV